MRGSRLGARLVRDERGFTLVEALVAGFVLVAGLLATIGVFDDSRDQNATGERHEIAVMQAEQAIEEIRGMPYEKVLLNAAAAQPTGISRLGGTPTAPSFTVRPGLAEWVANYATESTAATNAWVDPVTTASIGSEEAPLDLTIYRYVTWRDEECRIADLDALGVDLPGAISALQGPLTGLLNSLTGVLFALLNPTNDALITALQNRLNAVNGRLTQFPAALAGISELDLCDANLSLLEEAQQLSRLTDRLPAVTGAVDTLRATTTNLLTQILCLVSCQNTVSNQVNAVNTQLNCMLGSDDPNENAQYLDGLLSGLDDLADPASYDTYKNTKRVTVAVVAEPRTGVGPTEPVWASTVIRDPSSGLLGSGGATC